MVIQKNSAEVAYELAPNNGSIAGLLAVQLVAPQSTAAENAKAMRLARIALRRDPTAQDGAVALGLAAQIAGNTASAQMAFSYSEALSRRNLQTQLWAISEAISRNDIPATLNHYDIALRASTDAATLLFPVLVTAIADPAVRSNLVNTLARHPAWADGFISYMVANAADQQAAAALLRAIAHHRFAVPEADSSKLINSLINTNHIDQAWSYYSATHPHSSRTRSRDPNLHNITEAPSVFDWVPQNDGGISASIQPNADGGGLLTFSAPPSVGGPVVKQTQLLPPGNYVFESRIALSSADSHPYWSLSCLSGQTLGRIEVAASGNQSGRFRVPSGCPIQVLSLSINPSSDISGISGEVSKASLAPAR